MKKFILLLITTLLCVGCTEKILNVDYHVPTHEELKTMIINYAANQLPKTFDCTDDDDSYNIGTVTKITDCQLSDDETAYLTAEVVYYNSSEISTVTVPVDKIMMRNGVFSEYVHWETLGSTPNCPYTLLCSDVVLHTHSRNIDWCEACAQKVVLIDTKTRHMLAEYRCSVGNYTIVGATILPNYELIADEIFNTHPEWNDNLYGGNNKGVGGKMFGPWFYWNSGGIVIENDLHAKYRVTALYNDKIVVGYGNIIILSTANSAAAHVDHVSSGYIRPTYSPEDLGDLPGSPCGSFNIQYKY